MSFMLFVLYFFLFAWHFDRAIEHVKRFLPHSQKERILDVLSRMDDAVGDFFRGRLLIALILGFLLSGGWFLADVPYWFFLGMLTGLLNIVPYLSVVSWPIAILLKYLESATAAGAQSGTLLSVLVWPSAIYIAVQLLDNWVLTPWIQSGQTNLSAATILVVVLIGGAAAGVWGLIFAIPAAACVKILTQEFLVVPLRRWAALH
jgi:predicted PurR-regulated permease PerM